MINETPITSKERRDLWVSSHEYDEPEANHEGSQLAVPRHLDCMVATLRLAASLVMNVVQFHNRGPQKGGLTPCDLNHRCGVQKVHKTRASAVLGEARDLL